jgi:TolB-like protein/Flp pilus assembly protein TadD
LRRGAELVGMGPQVFDLLAYLVQNRGRVVSKDDLLDAVWSGRIVSESTLTSHINAVRKAIGDSGEEQRYVRTVARKGFRFVGTVIEEPGAVTYDTHAPVVTLPDKPSIAVLPFQNLSGDPAQDYFADGMAEDVLTALSRIQWLFVIARNSSFAYKGRAVGEKQIGRELGVRYLLEGSVRKSGGRLRIGGQLVEAETGANLWADRFDGGVEDIFSLQDRVTESVIGAISPKLEQAEIARVKRKPVGSLDAYDYFLRGMASIHQWTCDANDEALTHFTRAATLSPDFASAYAMSAFCYVRRKVNGGATDRAAESAEAVRLARRAVELGKDDANALARAGHALGFMAGDLDDAANYLDRALTLDPNLATAWFLSGWIRIFRGEPELALEHFARSMRLSPLDPSLCHMQNGIGFVHYLAGRYDEAVSWASKAYREQPRYLPSLGIMAASHAMAGRATEAAQAMARLRAIDPQLRVSTLRSWYPMRRDEDLARYQDGLRKAGLPE